MQAIEAKTQAPIPSDAPIKIAKYVSCGVFCNDFQDQSVVPTEIANAITEE